ncbi:MAG: hypothetical protein ACJ79R_03965 [Anaeromyxobacteraceae bacterium]
MEVRTCEKCNTPLDGRGTCITCAAAGRGLALLSRSGYASIREMHEVLEGGGVPAEIEQVPPRREQEAQHPLWNLYAPQGLVEQAGGILRQDWAGMLGDEEAARAAERGQRGLDLDAGGEIECPACGHHFVVSPGQADCPDCGLALGVPAEAAPDEAERA